MAQGAIQTVLSLAGKLLSRRHVIRNHLDCKIPERAHSDVPEASGWRPFPGIGALFCAPRKTPSEFHVAIHSLRPIGDSSGDQKLVSTRRRGYPVPSMSSSGALAPGGNTRSTHPSHVGQPRRSGKSDPLRVTHLRAAQTRCVRPVRAGSSLRPGKHHTVAKPHPHTPVSPRCPHPRPPGHASICAPMHDPNYYVASSRLSSGPNHSDPEHRQMSPPYTQ